jgi:aminobenzoyl-glutamate utilization protein B
MLSCAGTGFVFPWSNVMDMPASSEKTYALDFVERNRQALALLSDSVFYFGELGMQEHRTAELMSGLLEEHGFKVQRGISGFPTGFLATYGQGSPVIAMHTEYDANPSNSQKAGVAEQAEITPNAPGHCEGHNVNAAVMVSAALSLRYTMEKFGIRGTLKVFGAPAEEQLVSRPYYVRDGLFDDVDLAFHDHISHDFKTDYGLMQSAMISATFNFRGESAHAAVAPWKGRDALDAVVLMDMGMAQYREHFVPGMSAQRVITNGGEQPNVIPAKAAVWWYFRDANAEGARKLFEQAKKIAQGAALMTNTEYSVEVMAAVWPSRGNQVMAEAVQRNIEAIGQPAWSDEEEKFALALQKRAGVKEDGLRRAPLPLKGPTKQGASSNDSGDVSWKVPMVRVMFPANIPGINFHHWAAGAALATTIAHKGGLAGAKALAASVLDFLKDPALVAAAKEGFKQETGGMPYRSLLPEGQKPPIELNAVAMDKFRPLMEAHYVRERPVFRV